MEYIGVISKMQTNLLDVVEYKLPIGDSNIIVNDLIGKEIKLKWLGNIYCLKCGAKTRKSFFQGNCYNCFSTSPETAECILRPELCEAHLGKARDMKWSEENCLTEHVVYLAFTGGLKVGVTRSTQVPTRWIDQGATEAVIIAKTPNRHLAGVIEVDLKQYFSDKTNINKMLSNQLSLGIDILNEKKEAGELINPKYIEYFVKEDELYKIKYPVSTFPEKVKTVNFDKENEFSGILIGIKGQYLIFDNDRVFNVRKHGGYNVSLSF